MQIPAAQPYDGGREGKAQITKQFCLTFITALVETIPPHFSQLLQPVHSQRS